MMGNVFKPWHLVVLVLVVVVLFGWKKLPDAARSLARSLRIFKHELTAEEKDQPADPVSGTVVTPPPAQAPAQDAPARPASPADPAAPQSPVKGPEQH